MADFSLEHDKGFSGPEGIPLELRWMRDPSRPSDPDGGVDPDPGRPPVLLLHGASAQHETFCIPKRRSLAEFLWDEGYEPWLLDWRGSKRVTDNMSDSDLQRVRDEFDFDRAEEDLRLAFKRIAEVRDRGGHPQNIHVVAHCMGAGVLAQAIAKRRVPVERLGHVVLLTLGLFYETPLDGKVKSQFQVLDRLWSEGSVTVIDPRNPLDKNRWPPALKKVYEEIGTRWRPHPDGDREADSSHALCNRVSFMYGVPYRHANLLDQIHGVCRVRFAEGCVEPEVGERICAVGSLTKIAGAESLDQRLGAHDGLGFVYDVHVVSGSWRQKNAKGMLELSGSVGEFRDSDFDLWADDRKIGECRGKRSRHDVPYVLEDQFGAIPLRMYLHGAQNVRRGWAGRFADPSTALAKEKPMENRDYINPDALAIFQALPSVTLITGAENQLWHRDSIDRMHEWLKGGRNGSSGQLRKHVLPGYGHQDLLWGKQAKEQIFPLILKDGLGGRAKTIEFDPAAPLPGVQPTSSA